MPTRWRKALPSFVTRILPQFASSLALTCLTACGGGGGAHNAGPSHPMAAMNQQSGDSLARRDIPEWVMRIPRIKGSICAVGAVDPTFFRQDGVVSAGEAARGELARTVQVKIASVMYDEQTVHGSFVDQVSVQEVVGSISEVVLSGAQVQETWYDAVGAVSRKGMTYALACMPTDDSVAELAEKLKQVAPPESEDAEKRIARVKENARLAFDDLEAMEQKRANQ